MRCFARAAGRGDPLGGRDQARRRLVKQFVRREVDHREANLREQAVAALVLVELVPYPRQFEGVEVSVDRALLNFEVGR